MKIRIHILKIPLFLFIFGINCQPLIAGELEIINSEKNEKLVSAKKQPQELKFNVQRLQLLSQIIAKDYFYIHQFIREEQARIELKQSIQEMDKIFILLSSNLKSEKVGHLVSYLEGIRLEYKDILDKPYSTENGSLVLDFSETLFEGSQSIIKSIKNKEEQSELIYDVVLAQKIILQRISKFYIAFQAGFDDQMLITQLKDLVLEFEKLMEKMSRYKYGEEQLKDVKLIQKYWPISKKIYLSMEKGNLTLIVFISTSYMISSLERILDFHSVSRSK